MKAVSYRLTACPEHRRWAWLLVASALAAFLPLPLHAQNRIPDPHDGIDWAKARQFWAFRPPVVSSVPSVKRRDWPRQPVDHFVLARLERERLTPSPAADIRTFIRRVTFDLTGLPPTSDEVNAFLKDRSHDAHEKLVDRLLDSPGFGERMASMWLPLARFAEDQAHQVGDDTKFFYPNAFRYRQWIVDAFNRDLPYDRFITLQLAADRTEDSNQSDLPALGFLGLGPKYYNRNRLEVMSDEWEDRVDTVTRTFLGLTVACARCHDHKFDPITTRDYYALAGVFASTKMVNKKPDGSSEDAKTDAGKMSRETIHMVEDEKPQDLNVFVRGNVERKGPVAKRSFIRILSPGEPAPFNDGSGRKELADAIASRTNPLTARVMVNRVWGLFFGRPLVGSPSNFGAMGDHPTHPELLDYLSVRFVNSGWSVKKLVREMVLSSTYRQSSRQGTRAATRDPSNQFMSHMNRRRLTIEQWRDAVLFASGKLEQGGGPSQELDDPSNHRRTLYARVSRLKLNDTLMTFDYPDANVHAEKRTSTTTPMQKLFMLNSPFIVNQAAVLSARLTANASVHDAECVRHAYQTLFAREPDETELRLAMSFLSGPPSPGMSRWEQYTQVLITSNEMLYVD